MAHLLSGRVKLKKGAELGAGRTNFLKLDETEPNLGTPSDNNYILSSDTSGNRKWVPPSEIASSIKLTQLADVNPAGLTDLSVPSYNVVTQTFVMTETVYTITDGGNF